MPALYQAHVQRCRNEYFLHLSLTTRATPPCAISNLRHVHAGMTKSLCIPYNIPSSRVPYSRPRWTSSYLHPRCSRPSLVHAMFFSAFLFAALATALPPPSPYAHYRREATFVENSLEVDLGYSIYRGWHNESGELNVFQGSASPQKFPCTIALC